MVNMNRLSTSEKVQVIKCLCEGMSIRGTVRITGVAKNTVTKLLIEMGCACADYHHRNVRNLKVRRLQADEIWSFVGAKNKNATPEQKADGWGDVWTWTAIDADTKLIPCFTLGMRDPATARVFMEDLAGRLANRVQLTTDGLKLYLSAVDRAFGEDIDYAMLIKVYGNEPEGHKRYSPAICISCETRTVTGSPDSNHISTSYIERQNLTMRMSMRRFTRLTNAFSKKLENHAAAVAIYVMTYNFHRKHMTLGTTPAIAAGIADHIWSIEEVIGLLEKREQAVAA